MLNSLSEAITGGLKLVLSFFPDSPFAVLQDMAAGSQFADLLGMVNWFIPVYSFVSILEVWLSCIAIYYVWQIVLRRLNAIE